MKKQDHKALAHYLLESVGSGLLCERRLHRRLFLIGCVGPDYIPLTYLRGFRQSRAMLGHNTRYSMAHIQKSIKRLQRRGVRSLRDCFRLGTLMHYLADSFTFPHTEGFSGDMKEHRRYERDLHACFAGHLAIAEEGCVECGTAREGVLSFLRNRREAYEAHAEKTCARDAGQIICACRGVFSALCGM